MQDSSIDVAIIGAGPYGLSLAPYLRHCGVGFRIFGSPMRAWRDMAAGICLKSLDFATTIYAPERGYTFVDYCRAQGLSSREPCEIAKFADYGVWAQQRLVPELEEVEVVQVSRLSSGFVVTLATEERVRVSRVVVAIGLTYFERVPVELRSLPVELVSHTAQHRDYSRFRGKHVLVIGAGQSALEAAALLTENDARVEIVVRGSGVYFSSPPIEPRPLRHRLMYPMSVLGPGRLNFFLEHVPMAVHYLPRDRLVRLTRRHLGPWGTWWLRDRIEGQVPVHAQSRLTSAVAANGGVCLRARREGVGDVGFQVDHIVCGTGFEVDVDRVPFLERKLASEIRRVERAPALSRHFQTSVRGLYFIGAAAAFSFGPLLRFVAGASYAVPTVAGHLARSRGLLPARTPKVRRSAALPAD